MEVMAGDDWRVATVTAGPGTGKTVFATQWLTRARADGCAWVSLDEGDDRPERFWLYVTAALQRACPGAFSESERLVTETRSDWKAFGAQLLSDAEGLDRAIVLALEDLHTIHAPATFEALSWIVEQLPPQLRLVCTARSDLPLPLARWRARSWLVEVRQDDLAFDREETAALFAALGEDRLGDSELGLLQAHTEGWVAALQLAAISMRNGDAHAVARSFAGNNRMMADLLRSEVLDRQDDEVQDLMLCSSIADDFDADLCDALTGRRDSASQLRAIESETHFLVTVDDRPTYRYHQLLREMLRVELATRSPGRAEELHRVAADVLEARGDILRAVDHLLAVGDPDRAFELVFLPAVEGWDHDDVTAMAAWVSAFPIEYVGESIDRMLHFAFAFGMCARLDEAAAWLEKAQRALAVEPQPREEDLTRVDAFRLFLFMFDGSDEAGIECGQRAADRIDRGLELGLVGERVRPCLARAHLLDDDPESADEVLRGELHGTEIPTQVLPLALLARIALRRGHLTAAADYATRSIAAATAFGVPKHFGTLDAHIATVGVLTDRNQLAETGPVFEQLREITERHPVLVYRVLNRLDEVRVARARADTTRHSQCCTSSAGWSTNATDRACVDLSTRSKPG
jgi:LuxR family maltose regulon positive regulatory protein